MQGNDTNAQMPAVRFPHLHVVGMRKLDAAVAETTRLVGGNAYVLVKLSGGNIDSAQPLLPVKVPE